MLEGDHQRQFNKLIGLLDCEVELPDAWKEDFFAEDGVLITCDHERRRFVRHRMRGRAVVRVDVSLPAIPRDGTPAMVLMCDVSRNGFGFLSAREMFPEECWRLTLPNQTYRVVVARCRRLNDRCFFIGAQPADSAI